MEKQLKLTLAEQIERNLHGRSQRWVVTKMVDEGHEITEVQFTNKKKQYNGAKFSPEELFTLSNILGATLVND